MNANDPGPLTVVDITPPMDAVTRTADEEAQVLGIRRQRVGEDAVPRQPLLQVDPASESDYV